MRIFILYLLLRPVWIYLGVAERETVDLKGIEPLRRGLGRPTASNQAQSEYLRANFGWLLAFNLTFQTSRLF